VGREPVAVAVDPAARTAYVFNDGAVTVSVIDEATRTVTATIPVGHDPWGVAVDPATRTAYVTNASDGTVSVIDEATRTVTATIPVGHRPVAVAVDSAARTGYVTNAGGDTVSVIDEATRTVTATVPVGGDPDGVAVDPATRTAYVTNASDGTVSVLSAARPASVTTVTSSQNPSAFGRNVTFAATAGPADGGTITFSSGSTTLCRAVPLTHVSGRTYRAACTTTALPAGRDPITAVYPGDASYAPSVGKLTQTVTRARTALTASIGLSPRLAVTLTATVTASGRPLSGQPVSFSTGHTHLCARDTSSRGVATCVLTASQVLLAAQGNGLIRASYPGNTSYQPSSATAALPLWWPGL
jgi:YVTN family beta-propeller protein